MKKEILINEGWTFVMPENEPVVVNLPHTWNGIDGQDGGRGYRWGDYKRLACTYTKEFDKPKLKEGQRLRVVFRGVNSEGDVTINGTHVCRHEGGYSKFMIDITDYLQDKNTLEVLVDNSDKETVYPQYADFTFYGGIYRDVTFEIVDKDHFEYGDNCSPALRVTPTVVEGDPDGKVCVKAFTVGEGEVKISVIDKEGNVVATGKADEEIVVKDVHLWNGRIDPYMYTVKGELVVGGEVVDVAEAKIGFRFFSIDPNKGFFLNGKSYPLRGVCRHQDRPKLGNAISKKEHEEDMALIMEVGANTLRLAHYQHDDYFYDLCDINGLVVWAEIPYISKHFSASDANAESQMKELVNQQYNHPSIVVWGLSNEITMNKLSKEEQADMLEMHKKLNDLCHELDSTRLTTLACFAMAIWNDKTAHITDIVSWNLYLGWYTPFLWLNKAWFAVWRLLYPKRCIGMSEYGAEAMTNLHSVKPKRFDNTEEYQAIYHEYMAEFFAKRDYFWATHLWNMFDFAADARDQGDEAGMNHKGLVTFDRKIKKDSFYLYKAYWTKEPFVHLCGSRFVNRTGNKIDVKVYSNQEEVSIYQNGKLVATKKGNKVFKFKLPMEAENDIEVKCGDLSDKIHVTHVDKPDPNYIVKSGNSMSWEKT